MGDPIADTRTPARSSAFRNAARCPAVKSATFTDHALRSSRYVIDSAASVASCSSGSGEISSANPLSVTVIRAGCLSRAKSYGAARAGGLVDGADDLERGPAGLAVDRRRASFVDRGEQFADLRDVAGDVQGRWVGRRRGPGVPVRWLRAAARWLRAV